MTKAITGSGYAILPLINRILKYEWPFNLSSNKGVATTDISKFSSGAKTLALFILTLMTERQGLMISMQKDNSSKRCYLRLDGPSMYFNPQRGIYIRNSKK